MEEHIKKAGHAKQLLDDALLNEAFDAVENGFIRAMKQVDLTKDYQDVSKNRDSLMLGLMIVGKVKSYLQQAVTNGKIAEEALKEDF